MPRLDYLQRLEAESIHILREVVAECEKPVMLYSIGKDSSVMLHVALKAFYPAEAYHQDYATRHPNQPYIAFNDAPKVENLKKSFPELWVGKPDLSAAK